MPKTALDQLRDLARGHRCRSAEQDMNVILNSADLNGMHLVFFGYSTEIGPDAFFDLRRDPSFPILRAEDQMVMQ